MERMIDASTDCQVGVPTRIVAELTGLSIRQLDYWAQCNIFSPSVEQSNGPGTRKLYSTDDVVQLRLLKKLRCFRWSTQKLRNAIKVLRDVMEDSDPFGQAILFGSKSTLFVICKTLAGEQKFIHAAQNGGQQVMGIILETLEEEIRIDIERFINKK
jgi:DNA-binding transcriptional MerR regulator